MNALYSGPFVQWTFVPLFLFPFKAKEHPVVTGGFVMSQVFPPMLLRFTPYRMDLLPVGAVKAMHHGQMRHRHIQGFQKGTSCLGGLDSQPVLRV